MKTVIKIKSWGEKKKKGDCKRKEGEQSKRWRMKTGKRKKERMNW